MPATTNKKGGPKAALSHQSSTKLQGKFGSTSLQLLYMFLYGW